MPARPTTGPATDAGWFEDHAATFRAVLTHTGMSDKPVLPLIIGVGRDAADLGVEEIEHRDGTQTRVAYLALIGVDEAKRIAGRTFADGFFGERFRWDAKRDGNFARFNLTLRAGGREISGTINGDGAAALRRMALECLDAASDGARKVIRQAGGM